MANNIEINPVSDTPFDAATWDGVTTIAPSKKAVRDKVEALEGALPGTYVAGQIDGVVSKSNRIPVSVTAPLDGPAAVASGTSNTIGIVFNPSVTGNFTGISGSDPGFWWGLNLFAFTGNTAGDGAGLTSLVGGLVELAIRTPSGTINLARGLQSDVALFGADAGATITQAESLRVSAPRKKNGATGGSITNAYGLFVEEVSGATSSNFSVYVAGGTSRINGTLQVFGNIIGYGGGSGGTLSLVAGFTNPSTISLTATADGGSITHRLGWSGGAHKFNSSTNTNVFNITNAGLPQWVAAGNVQTTVGAAGGASALPASPTKYLKVVGDDGATYVIPAFAAA